VQSKIRLQLIQQSSDFEGKFIVSLCSSSEEHFISYTVPIATIRKASLYTVKAVSCSDQSNDASCSSIQVDTQELKKFNLAISLK